MQGPTCPEGLQGWICCPRDEPQGVSGILRTTGESSSCYLLALSQSEEEKSEENLCCRACARSSVLPFSAPSLCNTNPSGGAAPSVLPRGPRASSQRGEAAGGRIRNAAILAPPVQVEWECWGLEGRGMFIRRGVPQLCNGLAQPQPCVEISGS